MKSFFYSFPSKSVKQKLTQSLKLRIWDWYKWGIFCSRAISKSNSIRISWVLIIHSTKLESNELPAFRFPHSSYILINSTYWNIHFEQKEQTKWKIIFSELPVRLWRYHVSVLDWISSLVFSLRCLELVSSVILPPPLQRISSFDNMARFYKVFGPMNARAVDDVDTPDKRGAPGMSHRISHPQWLITLHWQWLILT